MTEMRKLMEAVDEEVSVEEGKKPDFLDLDGDGDKKEPMKKAADDKEDKEDVKENMFKAPVDEMDGGVAAPVDEMELPDNSGEMPPGADEMGEPVMVQEDDGYDLMNQAYVALGTSIDTLTKASLARNVKGTELDGIIDGLKGLRDQLEMVYHKS